MVDFLNPHGDVACRTCGSQLRESRLAGHYGMFMVLVAEGPGGGLAALTAAKVFPLYFISCQNHYTYGSKINLCVLLIPTVIYRM